jgi:phage terminase large subunit
LTVPDGGVLEIATPRAFVPLLEPARYKGAHGGRGSGKSHFFASLMVEENIAHKLDCVCLREVQKDLKFSVKKLLSDKIADMNAGWYFDIQDRIIKTKRGGVVIFEGMQNHTADSIKSLESFDRAWFEEAHKCSQKSLDILRPTIRKPGAQLWFSWNPENQSDPVDALLRGDTAPPDAIVIKTSYRDNPFLAAEMRSEIEYDRKRDPEKFRWVWEGDYLTNSEARIFRNWRVEEFEIAPDWIMRQGADWGFAVDPSVLVQCAIVGRTLYVTHEAYQVGAEIDFLPELFRTVPDAERWPTTADSARPETISYLQRHGFPRMLRAVKGARSLEEGIAFLQSFDIVVHPRCVHTIDELTLYSYKRDPLTDKILPIPQDKDNHVIDALRYACEGARRAAPVKRVVVEPAVYHGDGGWMA